MIENEKVKDYNEAVERAKKLYGNGIAEEIFTELKESDDDRIRKWIIDDIRYNMNNEPLNNSEYKKKAEKAIAWLEKQGKNSTDKIEPRFRVGDWITFYGGNSFKILKIETEINGVLDYLLLDQNGYDSYFNKTHVDKNARLWTIQDAKDGDVLCCKSGWMCIFKAINNHANTFSSYCFMDSDKWFFNSGSEGHTLDKEFIKTYNGEIHPATKEQRDALMKTMNDAGYEWDAEKKELKKLEKSSFHEGDWVVRGNTTAQILDVQEQYYIGLDINGKDFVSSRFLNSDKIHLWTIQDAKDGDIIHLGTVTAIFKKYIGSEKCICYCSFCKDGGFEIPIENGEDNVYGCYNATLATKEQRDLLFQKIKESGYEWDAEKKELKKLVKPKFDPKTLKPFDKVICKNGLDIWCCDFFSSYIESYVCKNVCISRSYLYCIPYNDETKHLVGTTDEAPEYYKYWEE